MVVGTKECWEPRLLISSTLVISSMAYLYDLDGDKTFSVEQSLVMVRLSFIG